MERETDTRTDEDGEVGMTVEEWGKDFKSFVNEQQMPRDDYKGIMEYIDDGLALLKEQETKQYNNHEVACIIADLFGDPCACNFNDIDEWLPDKCDFRETCCPNPVGVACWEQYLKHREGR